jgi:glycosyltransferase involved in cell wall biosynthesis
MQEYFKRYIQVHRAIKQAVTFTDALIVRVASPIGTIVADAALAHRFPYAAEVINDPIGTFAPGSIRHPLRPYIRWWFTRTLRRLCQTAAAALYVTETMLQRLYPCPGYSIGVSDVDLKDETFVAAPRTYVDLKPPYTLAFVGSFSMMYKSPDVMVQAVRMCVDDGLDMRLTMMGDGKHRPEIEALVQNLQLTDRIHFLGQLPGSQAVRNEFDKADLFVIPSRTEGLPRALIEAMARGMACIGTTVGGIPELLLPEHMIPPNDAPALAAKIKMFLNTPHLMANASSRNLQCARRYRSDHLRMKRNAFYEYVKEKTAECISSAGSL